MMLVLENGRDLLEILWVFAAAALQQADMARLTHRSRRQKATGRHVYELQLCANNVKKRGSNAIIFTAFPFGTCTPKGTPHIPVERFFFSIK